MRGGCGRGSVACFKTQRDYEEYLMGEVEEHIRWFNPYPDATLRSTQVKAAIRVLAWELWKLKEAASE